MDEKPNVKRIKPLDVPRLPGHVYFVSKDMWLCSAPGKGFGKTANTEQSSKEGKKPKITIRQVRPVPQPASKAIAKPEEHDRPQAELVQASQAQEDDKPSAPPQTFGIGHWRMRRLGGV